MSSFDKFAEGATKGAVAGNVAGNAAEVAVAAAGTIIGPAGTLGGIAISEAVIKPFATVAGGIVGGLWNLFEK
jgi:hypothetical protein